MEDRFWDRFTVTGRIEDYLRYRGENGQPIDRQQKKDRTDRTGEESVWESPLR